MTAKEYLNQAYYLNRTIEVKTKRAERLKALATSCSTNLSDMPKSPNHAKSPMEEALVKLLDLQDEIAKDIKKFVELNRKIAEAIRTVNDIEVEYVLEERYLNFRKWEDIVSSMDLSHDRVFYLHRKGLKLIRIPENYSKQ